MIPDLNEILSEDLEPKIGLGGIGRVEFAVDLARDGLGEEGLAVDEGPVLDVEVQVAEDCSHQAAEK